MDGSERNVPTSCKLQVQELCGSHIYHPFFWVTFIWYTDPGLLQILPRLSFLKGWYICRAKDAQPTAVVSKKIYNCF